MRAVIIYPNAVIHETRTSQEDSFPSLFRHSPSMNLVVACHESYLDSTSPTNAPGNELVRVLYGEEDADVRGPVLVRSHYLNEDLSNEVVAWLRSFL